MSLEDDSSISEINILSDGRICLFGASQQVLELFSTIALGDPALQSRIERLCATDGKQPMKPNDTCSAKDDEIIKNRARW